MTKFVAIAAVCLAAILAVAVGQGEAEEQRTLRDMQCLREVQENPLDACRQVLQHQLTGGTGTGYGPFQWITGLRTQCCQQLQDVSRECRCAAIRRMVWGYEQTMPPLEGGGSGSREGRPCSQQGSGYPPGCGGEMGWRRQQEGGGQGGQGCGCRQIQQPATTSVRLGKARLLYAAQLPIMCSIEPQECDVFSGAGTESYRSVESARRAGHACM
jgi:hypothetical protein